MKNLRGLVGVYEKILTPKGGSKNSLANHEVGGRYTHKNAKFWTGLQKLLYQLRWGLQKFCT